jgi:hypothetical protein
VARESRVATFVELLKQACESNDVRAIIEAMRICGYINEIQYSALNTEWSQRQPSGMVRSDGAETIELSRDPEEILPSQY